MRKLSEYVAEYQKQMELGEVQIAYEQLLKYMMRLKAHCSNGFPEEFDFGNVSPGYMDFSYFPFFNAFLRKRKLRFGIVLNHKKMRFELWLMGQNAQVQKEYWDLLKATNWNRELTAMPKYSVLETVLVDMPDFDDLDALSFKIEKAAADAVEEILKCIK